MKIVKNEDWNVKMGRRKRNNVVHYIYPHIYIIVANPKANCPGLNIVRDTQKKYDCYKKGYPVSKYPEITSDGDMKGQTIVLLHNIIHYLKQYSIPKDNFDKHTPVYKYFIYTYSMEIIDNIRFMMAYCDLINYLHIYYCPPVRTGRPTQQSTDIFRIPLKKNGRFACKYVNGFFTRKVFTNNYFRQAKEDALIHEEDSTNYGK